jgi:hypothetical protein
MDEEHPAGYELGAPSSEVGPFDVFSMAAVEEHEAEWCAPVGRDGSRVADDADHGAVRTAFVDSAPPSWKRLHQSGRRVNKNRIMVRPAGLHLF